MQILLLFFEFTFIIDNYSNRRVERLVLWFLDYFNNIKRYNIDSDIQKDVIDYLVHISLRRTCLFYLSAYLLYEVFKL